MTELSVHDAIAAFLEARTACDTAKTSAYEAVPDWPHLHAALTYAQLQLVTAWLDAERRMLAANNAVLDARIRSGSGCC